MSIRREDFKEIYNHMNYLEQIKSKKNGLETNTLLDFASKEQLEEIRRGESKNLSFLDITPLEIKKHQEFAINTYVNLKRRIKKDEFLEELAKEENIDFMLSYDWYVSYGIRYEC